MSQAKGALAQLLLQRQSAFRTAPGSVAAFRMPFTKWDSGKNLNQQTDDSISASPLQAKKSAGNPVLNPTLNSILDLRSVGHILALLLGLPTVRSAVVKSAASLVTGVTANFADAVTAPGTGTLTYTAAGTLLSWTAPGLLAGVAQNVSAGGRFTLASGTTPSASSSKYPGSTPCSPSCPPSTSPRTTSSSRTLSGR